MADRNMVALAKGAHALKGAAGSIVAERSHKAAFAVERAAKSGDLALSNETFGELLLELDALEAVLNIGESSDDRQA